MAIMSITTVLTGSRHSSKTLRATVTSKDAPSKLHDGPVSRLNDRLIVTKQHRCLSHTQAACHHLPLTAGSTRKGPSSRSRRRAKRPRHKPCKLVVLLHWFLIARYPRSPTRIAPPTNPPIAPIGSNTPHQRHHQPSQTHYTRPDTPCTTAIPLCIAFINTIKHVHQHNTLPIQADQLLVLKHGCRLAGLHSHVSPKIMYPTSNTNASTAP